jgi:hypothetical protein
MLTATETARVQKFTADMDADTARAMLNLFDHSKPGCDEATYEMMDAAHNGQKVSNATTNAFHRYGLVLASGDIPKAIKALLSHTLRCSTIDAKRFHGPVRDGMGCFTLASTTEPSKTI